MPYGKVSFVMRLSPRQPGYVMTVCAAASVDRAAVNINAGSIFARLGVRAIVEMVVRSGSTRSYCAPRGSLVLVVVVPFERTIHPQMEKGIPERTGPTSLFLE